jgi:glutamate N-acetyltransferase/amino-acid N-acetyltransferase
MSSAKSNVTIDSSNEKMFAHALNLVMDFMAKALVRDGEGATKLVTYKIRGAKDNIEAEKVAKTLSNSLLIKTALYGEDPNWGRLAMSIGASGVACDETKLTISYDDVVLYEKGVNLFNDEIEVLAGNVMKQAEFDITCDLGMGEGSFDAYGCDLGYKYVEINADYRT